MTDYVPKMVHLPGTKLTPEVVLHRTLQKLEHIKAVTVMIQWNDDSYDADWSQMKVSELCMAERQLHLNIDETLHGKNQKPSTKPAT